MILLLLYLRYTGMCAANFFNGEKLRRHGEEKFQILMSSAYFFVQSIFKLPSQHAGGIPTSKLDKGKFKIFQMNGTQVKRE